MKKQRKALAALVLLAVAAFVLSSAVGGHGTLPAPASASPAGAVTALDSEAALSFASGTPSGEATRAEAPPTRPPSPASASATHDGNGSISRRPAAEKAQLTHRVSTASRTLSNEPAPIPATEAPRARTPDNSRSKEKSGFAVGQFQNRAGSSFALSRVTCLIDGRTVYSGPGGNRFELFQSALAPGDHTVTVQADYLIRGAGPFSYAKGFRYKVLSGRRFSVGAGQPVRVSVVGYEKGGPTRDFDQRLALAISTG
jgi:hypothetical protein